MPESALKIKIASKRGDFFIGTKFVLKQINCIFVKN